MMKTKQWRGLGFVVLEVLCFLVYLLFIAFILGILHGVG